MPSYAEGLVVAAIGLLAAVGALAVPAAYAGETWAGTLPMAAGLLLAGCGGNIAWTARRTADNDQSLHADGAVQRVLTFFLLALAYSGLIVCFGYEIPTAIAAMAALWMFGLRSATSLVVGAVACPLFFHLVFFRLLGVFPPRGEVFDLARLLAE